MVTEKNKQTNKQTLCSVDFTFGICFIWLFHFRYVVYLANAESLPGLYFKKWYLSCYVQICKCKIKAAISPGSSSPIVGIRTLRLPLWSYHTSFPLTRFLFDVLHGILVSFASFGLVLSSVSCLVLQIRPPNTFLENSNSTPRYSNKSGLWRQGLIILWISFFSF